MGDGPITRRRLAGYALVAAAAMGWGTWPLILRHAPMPPALQSSIVMAVLTLGSFPVMLRDRVRERARLVHWLGVASLGVADALNIWLFFAAYQRTTVAVAVLTHYLTPVFVAVSAPLLLGERMRMRTITAVVISFAGLVLLLEPWRADLRARDVVGAALGAGSAVFYASQVILNKRLLHVFSAGELLFFHGLVGLPLLCATLSPTALGEASPSAIAIVIAGALGPGVLSGLAFVWGLRRIAASQASILTLLEPCVAVALAVLFLGQSIGTLPIAGGGLILIGAILVMS
jgi:drug/metabolite transporter (DMT)-like permease